VPIPPVRQVLLREDGLGDYQFGAPPDTVLPGLTAMLGPPTEDTTERGSLPGGYGGENTTLRSVRYGNLSLVFVDWPYFRNERVMQWAHWSVDDGEPAPPNTAFVTEAGIAIGSTVSQLRQAYGDALRLATEIDECTDKWHWSVASASPLGITGDLSGPVTDGTRVTRLTAGAQSAC
jgi:hypothetical protein